VAFRKAISTQPNGLYERSPNFKNYREAAQSLLKLGISLREEGNHFAAEADFWIAETITSIGALEEEIVNNSDDDFFKFTRQARQRIYDDGRSGSGIKGLPGWGLLASDGDYNRYLIPKINVADEARLAAAETYRMGLRRKRETN